MVTAVPLALTLVISVQVKRCPEIIYKKYSSQTLFDCYTPTTAMVTYQFKKSTPINLIQNEINSNSERC
jgi:hypothetical protein